MDSTLQRLRAVCAATARLLYDMSICSEFAIKVESCQKSIAPNFWAFFAIPTFRGGPSKNCTQVHQSINQSINQKLENTPYVGLSSPIRRRSRSLGITPASGKVS